MKTICPCKLLEEIAWPRLRWVTRQTKKRSNQKLVFLNSHKKGRERNERRARPQDKGKDHSSLSFQGKNLLPYWGRPTPLWLWREWLQLRWGDRSQQGNILKKNYFEWYYCLLLGGCGAPLQGRWAQVETGYCQVREIAIIDSRHLHFLSCADILIIRMATSGRYRKCGLNLYSRRMLCSTPCKQKCYDINTTPIKIWIAVGTTWSGTESSSCCLLFVSFSFALANNSGYIVTLHPHQRE